MEVPLRTRRGYTAIDAICQTVTVTTLFYKTQNHTQLNEH